ncbi:hypothetical protein AcW2_003958 [Taiwanofungus camphoratus]|nr:hypothetical protein AcW2_003958 [Antrodia cinnamomea]
MSRTMKIAVEGCCHGELDSIYSHIASLELRHGYKIDLLLICGDFQAVRNYQDLQCMAVPDKYRQLGGFCKYYTGEKKAPILTIVIGGNHEASNYFWELYHGGWLAPNIYFLGHAGCVQVNGIRIAGASGIFKPKDFREGHWERVPYNRWSMRSIYHIREFNVRRLSLLSSPTIFLSHDWPQSIEHHGNVSELLRRKPYFRDDISKGALGSPPMMGLLRTLQPEWWFSAHLHCRFEAEVVHEGRKELASSHGEKLVGAANPDEIIIEDDEFEAADSAGLIVASSLKAFHQEVPSMEKTDAQLSSHNPEEIMLEDEVENVVTPAPAPPPLRTTKFLALDKCLPKRQFLEVIDVIVPSDFNSPQSSDPTQFHTEPVLEFDPEWLAITRAFHPHMSLDHSQHPYPDEAEARAAVQNELEWVMKHVIAGKHVRRIDDCQKFVVNVPPPGSEGPNKKQQPPYYPNPQTEAFCSMLEVENKINPPLLSEELHQSPHISTR